MPEIIDVTPEKPWYQKFGDMPAWGKKAIAWFAGCGCLAIMFGGVAILVIVFGTRGCGASHSESQVVAQPMSQAEIDRIASEVARKLPTAPPRPSWKSGEQLWEEYAERHREKE